MSARLLGTIYFDILYKKKLQILRLNKIFLIILFLKEVYLTHTFFSLLYISIQIHSMILH